MGGERTILNRWPRPGRFVALLAISALAVGCGDEQEGEGPETIRVGYEFDLDPGDLGDAVAWERSEESQALSVEFRELGGTQAIVTGLRRGEIEIANMNQTTAINAIANGADLKAILATKIRPEWVLGARGELTEPDDLEGKRIAVYGPGSETVYHVDLTLRGAGLAEDDVEILNLGESENRAAALAAGRIDATPLEFVDHLRLIDAGEEINLLSKLSEISPERGPTVYVVSESLLQEDPELLDRVTAGLVEGFRYLYTPEGERAWIEEAQAGPLEDDPPSLVAEAYAFYRDLGFWPRGEPIGEAEYQRSCELWRRTGQVEECLAFSEVWDTSLWAAASG